MPNARGCEAALEAGAHKISIPLSLSETHSVKNVRRDHAQMLEEIAVCQALVDQVPEAQRPDFEVGLSTAFGCTIEGAVDEAFVIDMAERVLGLGVAEVGLSDTTGMGNPAQVVLASRQLILLTRGSMGSDTGIVVAWIVEKSVLLRLITPVSFRNQISDPMT